MRADVKPLYNIENRSVLHQVIPLDTPFNVSIEPTFLCNFKCRYCVHSLPNHELKEKGYRFDTLKWSVFEETVRQLKEFPHKVKMICLAGVGEPLLHDMFPDMVKYLKQSGVVEKVEAISNGVLLNPKLSDKIVASGLDRLRISLQGLTDDTYKEVCGTPIDFQGFLKELSYFFKNRRDTELFIKIIDNAITKEEEPLFFETFGNICDRIYVEKTTPFFADVNYDYLLKSKNVNKHGEKNSNLNVCPSPFYQLYINAGGDIAACLGRMFEKNKKNIATCALLDFWHSEERSRFLKFQLQGRRFEDGICKACYSVYEHSHDQDKLDFHANEVLSRIYYPGGEK